MKRIAAAALILLALTSLTYAEFNFDGKVYSERWESAAGGAAMKEFLSGEETTENWQTMLTLQAHPAAKSTREVTGPYYDARKAIVALPPKLHHKKEGDGSDIVLELFLGAPGRTPHIEFVLARFIETDSGVLVAVYSHKLPAVKNVNVSEIMKKKEGWISELFGLSSDLIHKEFQPVDDGNAEKPLGDERTP